MRQCSLCSVIQRQLATALEFVPDGGGGNHFPGGGPRLRHAELVVSQFRQARSCGILCGAPRPIECWPLFAGEETNDITPHFNRGGRRPAIVANADQLAPGAETVDAWDLRASHNWYDLVVTCAEAPGFQRRFAGHGEDDKPSLSDPLLGRQT